MTAAIRHLLTYRRLPEVIHFDGLSTGVRSQTAKLAPGANGPGEASDPSGSSIQVSLGKQGLKLLRKNAPLEKLVIDHIEKTPTEN